MLVVRRIAIANRHHVVSPKLIGSRTMTMPARQIEYVDIGVNLGDDMFHGRYHGKKAHPPDLDSVMERARNAGVVAQIVTAGSLKEVREVVDLVKRHDNLYATAGIHPTRTSGVDDEGRYLDELRRHLDAEAITRNPKGCIVAIGECGLDYDRLKFSTAEVQKRHFPRQLSLAKEYALPLFLHCRAAQQDFLQIMQAEADAIAQACSSATSEADPSGRRRIGVAHCFTGTVDEMRELVGQGLFIGLTGCSFKEEEGIRVAKEVPLEYLMLETDAPWCDLRSTHASHALLTAFAGKEAQLASLYAPPSVKKEKWEATKQVKSRNEPCAIGNVAAVVAEAKGLAVDVVAKAARENTRFLFGV